MPIKLQGWKRWELLLLKGSIALLVFPCMFLAGLLLVSFGLSPVLNLAGPLDPSLWIVVPVMALSYAGGLVIAVLACRKVWPTVVPGPAGGE